MTTFSLKEAHLKAITKIITVSIVDVNKAMLLLKLKSIPINGISDAHNTTSVLMLLTIYPLI